MLSYFQILIYKIYCFIMNINQKQFNKVLNYEKRYPVIKCINNSYLNENNIVKDLLINYLYGDFIILRFENNIDVIFFEDINYIKSKLLVNFLKKKKENIKNKFKINLTYEDFYINLILKYLIYFENDTVELIYNNNNMIPFIFKDNFLNGIIFNLNYQELNHLRILTEYFGIDSLNSKINIILEMINTTIQETDFVINIKESLSVYII